MKIHPEIKDALDATGLPWHITDGGKHYKVFVAARLCIVLSKGGDARKSGWRRVTREQMAIKTIRKFVAGLASIP